MKKPRLLVIAKTAPLHDRASGDYRLFQILGILAKEFEIDYLSTWHPVIHKKEGRLDYIVRDANFNTDRFEFIEEPYLDDLRAIGVKPLNQVMPEPFTMRPVNDYDIRPFLAAKRYDIVWVEFFYVADQYINQIRRFQPGASVICDSVDLHFRRLARQHHYLEHGVKYLVNWRQEKKKPGASHRQKVQDHRNYADHVREHEIKAYEKCDAVAVVSEDDAQELRRLAPDVRQLFIPNVHRPPKERREGFAPFESRKGCIFVGNYDHNPNVSSAIYLKHEIAPLLEPRNIPLKIAGSNPPKIVRTMATHGPAASIITVTGYVPDTFPHLQEAKVSIAPILFGAGMNGKIGEAIAAGLPVVTTPLGANGMGLVHEDHCLVADTPESFVHAVERLHNDKALWEKLQRNALDALRGRYALDELRERILAQVKKVLPKHHGKNSGDAPKLLKELKLPPPKFTLPKNPEISVVLLTFNQWKYTELCLRSLSHSFKAHPELPVELIVVDNASSDETCAELEKIKGIRLILNGKNLGFAAGNNVGIRAARGKAVVVLNNDTVVPPDWLVRLKNHADSIPDLGILGPSTNTESGQALFEARYNSLAEFLHFNEKLGEENLGAWETARKISGLCFYLPHRTIREVGLLDTEFGIGYFEDDDYCLRCVDKGLKLVWAKDVYVHHFGSMSFEGNNMKRLKFLENGMNKFIFKWGKRGLEHIAKAHKETLIRLRKPKGLKA